MKKFHSFAALEVVNMATSDETSISVEYEKEHYKEFLVDLFLTDAENIWEMRCL